MKHLHGKKFVIFIFLLLLICVLVFIVLRKKTTDPNKKSTITSQYGKVIREDLVQRVTIAGEVIPYRRSIITAPYSGYVRKIYPHVGDPVKLGDPIVIVSQSLQSISNEFPLRSPLNGTVVRIEKVEGEYVKEGDNTNYILRIDDLSKLFINSNVPEIDRVKIKLGQEAIIKASAILNRTYKGKITELSLSSREKEGWSRSQVIEFPIKIELSDFDSQLKSGMSVIIDIITDKKNNILTLRHEYIHQENDSYYVVLANGERKEIKIGLQNEESSEILGELKEGEIVKIVDFSELNETRR